MTRDVRTDSRSPELGRQVDEVTTVVSMLSYPLHLEQDEIGQHVTLYLIPEAFDHWAQSISLLVLSHEPLVVANGRAREQRQHLQAALVTNREIGVAIGVLMAAHRLNKEDASRGCG